MPNIVGMRGMLRERRRRDTDIGAVAPAPVTVVSPALAEALFSDLEAVGRLRPRGDGAKEAFLRSPAVDQLGTYPGAVRRRALRQLPHGIPTAKSWLAVCRLYPGPGSR